MKTKPRKSWKGWALLYKGEPRNVTLDPYKPVYPLVRKGWRRLRIVIREVR